MNKIFTMLEITFKDMDAIFVYDCKANKIYIKFINKTDSVIVETFLKILNFEISYLFSYNIMYIYNVTKKESECL